MSSKPLFSGIFPALVSPLDTEGLVMESSLRKLVTYLCASGISGMYACGGTGEGLLLPTDTRKEILAVVSDQLRVMQHGGSRPKLLAHVGAAEPSNVKDLAMHAALLGVDAVSTIPPLYYSYTKEKICSYYEWIADVSTVPVVIYAAAQANIAFTADMLERLARHPNIRGLKFTGYNLYELMRMRKVVPPDFSILNGADEILVFGLLAGADGGIGATYNVMPRVFCTLYDAFASGRITQAKELQEQINSVISVLVKYPVIAGVKWMLSNMGMECGDEVFPMDGLDASKRESLLHDLEDLSWRMICG